MIIPQIPSEQCTLQQAIVLCLRKAVVNNLATPSAPAAAAAAAETVQPSEHAALML
jgi:hypothetical protein